MNTSRDRLFSIAEEVRNWADNNRHHYHVPEDLMGMCVIASAQLFTKLQENGIEAYIAINSDESHGFVLVGQTVVDITASQFGYTDIYIENEHEVADEEIWGVGTVFRSVKAVREYQITSGWPKCQIISEEVAI